MRILERFIHQELIQRATIYINLNLTKYIQYFTYYFFLTLPD